MDLEKIIILALVTYAIIKWWFDSSLMDHIIEATTMGKYNCFNSFLETFDEKPIGKLFAELFDCPWCLAFHVALWVNVIFNPFSDIFTSIASILATSGGAMAIYRFDSKD